MQDPAVKTISLKPVHIMTSGEGGKKVFPSLGEKFSVRWSHTKGVTLSTEIMDLSKKK